MPGSELVLYDTWSYCNYEGILAILWYGEHILTTTARYASCYNMWQIMLRSLVGRAGHTPQLLRPADPAVFRLLKIVTCQFPRNNVLKFHLTPGRFLVFLSFTLSPLASRKVSKLSQYQPCWGLSNRGFRPSNISGLFISRFSTIIISQHCISQYKKES